MQQLSVTAVIYVTYSAFQTKYIQTDIYTHYTIDRGFRCAGSGGCSTSRSFPGPISGIAVALPNGVALKKVGPLTVVVHPIPVHIVRLGDHEVPVTEGAGVRTVVRRHGGQEKFKTGNVSTPCFLFHLFFVW